MTSQQQSEYVIRVPKRNEMRRYSVLRFNGSDKVDTAKWGAPSELKLERVDNKNVVMSNVTVQEYGEGTEYGKAAREEARRKKYGRMSRSYVIDNQPWKMSYKDPEGRERKMGSIREHGVNHADYWVFLKVGEEFMAYKVDDQHNFIPAIRHKTLDIDQAEEKFSQRNKVMNQFALKAQIQSTLKADEDDEQMLDTKAHKGLKIRDEYSDQDSDGDDEVDKGEEEGEKKKKKKKKRDEPKKDKRVRVTDKDEVARYESSDGEDEGREVDYMTDSGSDSDREQIKVDEKVEKELVGVAEEAGLQSDVSEDSDDDDLAKKLQGRDDDKKKDNLDIEERDSSGSDSDDPDKDKFNSPVFMQKKEASESSGASKKRPAEPTPSSSSNSGEPAKKAAKTEPVADGLNEETVRKYLRRKPHTTKELLSKIKSKCVGMEKGDIVAKLATILKTIEPHQSRQKVGKKEVMFFSLTNKID